MPTWPPKSSDNGAMLSLAPSAMISETNLFSNTANIPESSFGIIRLSSWNQGSEKMKIAVSGQTTGLLKLRSAQNNCLELEIDLQRLKL